MISRFLLDTHVLVRYIVEPRRLSKEQARVVREARRRHEPVAISAITLLELATLFGEGSTRTRVPVGDIFRQLASSQAFQILPFSVEIATEVALLGRFIRDPADRAIVSTARVHKLQLVTSDQRIIESKLVPVIV